MAIAFDSYAVGNGSSKTWSHTCSGLSRILIVNILDYDDGYDTVTAVTYNGVSMTKFGTTGGYASPWYLINPATGTNTISVTSPGAASAIIAQSVSYTGVKQSGFPDSLIQTNSPGSSPYTMTTTVVASNCWLVSFCFFVNGSQYLSMSSNRTDRGQLQTSPASRWYDMLASDSNGTVGTGSQSTVITIPSGGVAGFGYWSILSLAPYTAPVNNGNFLAFT